MALPRMSPRLRQTLSQLTRLGLPLGALVLMSTIFLASRSVDPTRAVALSDLDLDTIAREPRIGTARIAGVTADAAAVTIAASAMRSVNDPRARAPLHLALEGPSGEVRFAGGGSVTFGAAMGQLDQAGDLVRLQDAVWLRSGSGYDLRLTALEADLAATEITGTGPVEGTGPAGSLRADRLRIFALPSEPGGTAGRDGGGGYLLAFAGDVRLIYQPEQ